MWQLAGMASTCRKGNAQRDLKDFQVHPPAGAPNPIDNSSFQLKETSLNSNVGLDLVSSFSFCEEKLQNLMISLFLDMDIKSDTSKAGQVNCK